MELFMLSKKLGVDACTAACVSAISDASEDKWPIKFGMTPKDAKVHRKILKEFRVANRFANASNHPPERRQGGQRLTDGTNRSPAGHHRKGTGTKPRPPPEGRKKEVHKHTLPNVLALLSASSR
jgi:hypothetical protein